MTYLQTDVTYFYTDVNNALSILSCVGSKLETSRPEATKPDIRCGGLQRLVTAAVFNPLQPNFI
jgi:hypothetical protein